MSIVKHIKFKLGYFDRKLQTSHTITQSYSGLTQPNFLNNSMKIHFDKNKHAL